VFNVAYNITVDITGNGSVTVSSSDGSFTVTVSGSGQHQISVPSSITSLIFTVVADTGNVFESIRLNNNGVLRDVPQTFAVSTGDVIYAQFGKEKDDGVSSLLIWALILLIVAATLFILFLLASVRYRATGAITYNGNGLEGVNVEYIMNGKSGTAVTDRNGHYRIRALAGSEVTITNVAMEGYAVSETLPEPFVMEKATTVDFTMEKV
jgi:hypothetical protein